VNITATSRRSRPLLTLDARGPDWGAEALTR
jgi:hypothetical protein